MEAKKPFLFHLPVIFMAILLFSSCENSLNDIKKISFNDEDKPISRSTGVDIIYSDSAKVKLRILTPLMIETTKDNKSTREMTKGVKVIFYDDDLKEKGTVVSDYAIQKEKDNIIEFRQNVVATNVQGETFKSDELIYDLGNKKLYSTKSVQITMVGGNTIEGTGFNSNESLYPWHINQSSGIFHVNEKQANP